MSEERFEVVIDVDNTIEYISDKVAMEDIDFADFLELANELHNENEALKDLNNQELQDFRNNLMDCINDEINNVKEGLKSKSIGESANIALVILYRLKKELS